MKQSQFPRSSRVLSYNNHTMPETERTGQQQAGGSSAEARGILQTVPPAWGSAPAEYTHRSLVGWYSLSSIADCSSSVRATDTRVAFARAVYYGNRKQARTGLEFDYTSLTVQRWVMDNQVQIQPSLFMDDEPRNKKKQKINIRMSISSNILSEFTYIQNSEIIYNVHGMYTKNAYKWRAVAFAQPFQSDFVNIKGRKRRKTPHVYI